jgi:hypothetical protein
MDNRADNYEPELEPFTTDNKTSRNSVDTNLALLRSDIAYIKRDVSNINRKLDDDYITKEEFAPVKALVYGMAAVILTGFIGAVLSFVYKTHS